MKERLGIKERPNRGIFYGYVYWYGKNVLFPWYKYNEKEVIMTLDRKEEEEENEIG